MRLGWKEFSWILVQEGNWGEDGSRRAEHDPAPPVK
jgi:hypothetical protein